MEKAVSATNRFINIRYIVNKNNLVILLFLLFEFGLAPAADQKTASEIVDCQQDRLTINASNTSLIKILAEIQKKCSVKIEGLEIRQEEQIAYFSKKGPLENVLKAFLQHLGEKSYAFEFSNGMLVRVAVMPKSKGDPLLVNTQPYAPEKPNGTVKVVKVVKVIQGSQAQSSGLMKGDIILEYNGLVISSVDELIKATKEKTSADQVELIVLRENYRLRFIFNGGFIGVRIKEVLIPEKDLAVF